MARAPRRSPCSRRASRPQGGSGSCCPTGYGKPRPETRAGGGRSPVRRRSTGSTPRGCCAGTVAKRGAPFERDPRLTDLPRSLGISKVFVDESGHLEHGDLTAAEDRTEVLIGVDHAAVLRVLETFPLDVLPELLGDFRAWHRGAADYRGEITARLHRLHECRVRRALLARGFSAGLP